MGWSGILTASSAVGTTITYAPDTTGRHEYTVSAFTAPKDGIYRFTLKGSGGAVTGSQWDSHWSSARGSGGTGGLTVGYLNMTAGQTVYVGAGGCCSAAFVSKTNVGSLSAAGSASNLWFVAGAGGDGGSMWDNSNQWACHNYATSGGSGGGVSGGGSTDGTSTPVSGATQTAGGSNTAGASGSFGRGRGGSYHNAGDGLSGSFSYTTGDGGDGLYGGANGVRYNNVAYGGSGGSGYINTASITVGGMTYTNSTQQGGGAGSNSYGSVTVTYTASAFLPITYNGTQLSKIIYNGTTLTSLVYNGTKVF